MKRFLLPGLALVFVLAASGCGESLDNVVRDSIGYQNEMSAILEEVKDKESAKNARSELESLKKKIGDIESRAKRTLKDKKDTEVLEELGKSMAKHGEKIKDAEQRYRKALAGLTDETRAILDDVLVPLRPQ